MDIHRQTEKGIIQIRPVEKWNDARAGKHPEYIIDNIIAAAYFEIIAPIYSFCFIAKAAGQPAADAEFKEVPVQIDLIIEAQGDHGTENRVRREGKDSSHFYALGAPRPHLVVPHALPPGDVGHAPGFINGYFLVQRGGDAFRGLFDIAVCQERHFGLVNVLAGGAFADHGYDGFAVVKKLLVGFFGCIALVAVLPDDDDLFAACAGIGICLVRLFPAYIESDRGDFEVFIGAHGLRRRFQFAVRLDEFRRFYGRDRYAVRDFSVFVGQKHPEGVGKTFIGVG